MTQTEILGKTFFPGSRKEVKLQGLQLLRDSEGNPRIKIDALMPFSDGKLTGMPSWVGEAFDHLGREDTLERSTKFEAQMEGMTLSIYELPESAEPSKTAAACMLRNFSMTREKEDEEDEELGEVALKFVLYIPGDKRLWTWLYDFHRRRFWIRFENTQEELPEAKPSTDQLPLVGDQFDGERRQDLSPAKDAEFAAKPAKGKKEPVPQ
jgi:hypothetical protein